VEERLMEYQRVHDAKMLVLRQVRSSDDEAYTGTPKVNRRSNMLAQKHCAGRDVHARLSADAVPPPPQGDETPRPCDVTPRINKRSSEMAYRGVASQFEWERARQQRHEAKRLEQEAQQRQENSGYPRIDEESRRLAERVSTYTDPMRLVLPVQERLLRHQETMDSRREALRIEIAAAERKGSNIMTPRKKVVRSQSAEAEAASRLFSDAEERRRAAEERARQEELMGLIDKNGHLLYQPRITPLAAVASAARGDVDVFTHLAQSREPRGAKKDHSQGENDKENTGRPLLGAYSVLLANLTRPQDVDTFERLSKSKTVPDESHTRSRSDADARNCFKPTVDSHSNRIDKERRGDVSDRIQLLYQRQAAYDAHRRRQQQEKEATEAMEAEALDRLRSSRHHIRVGGTSTPKRGDLRCVTPDAAYARMKAWSDRSHNKLNALRAEAKEGEIAECTFTPKVTRRQSITPSARASKNHF
jgi:hypothetical protein